jgi:signal transduction histidine kinase
LAPREKLTAMLPEPKAISLKIVRAPSVPQTQANADNLSSLSKQESSLKSDYGQRAQAIDVQQMNAIAQNRSMSQSPAVADSPQPVSTTNADFSGAPMTPLWIEGQLILARRVLVGGKQYVQGCLLDWPVIRRDLLAGVKDLLPEADLVPTGDNHAADESRRLAALPIRLLPGTVQFADDKNRSPLMLSLFVAWVCLFAAAVAIIGLLSGVIRLSARRASFVSAVTHELRTPLTTFQMYAEMLASDMVPDEPQKKEYLNTLRAEAIRLTHLVENVLAYARLERGRLDRRLETVALSDLIASMQNRLADRAAQAGMQLAVENTAAELSVKTNVSAVEQILFNLVDNACKYASSADDKRIHVLLQEENGQAAVRVEDHGSGIAPEMRRRLFRSFSKTAREAAHSAPGIGLGLALSRRLARDLGGGLRYEEKPTPGACFVLTLPLA